MSATSDTPSVSHWLPWDGPDELAEFKVKALEIAAVEKAKPAPAAKPRKELTWADFEARDMS